jgi:transporter, YbiR family
VLSAVLVNDTICVVLTPLVLEIVLAAGVAPLPYLIALAAASNVGSVATITGNPQNIIIGSVSGLSYARFSGALVPVALAGLVVVFGVIALMVARAVEARGCAEASGLSGDGASGVDRQGAAVAWYFSWRPVCAG